MVEYFEYLSIDRLVYTDPLLNFLAGGTGAGGSQAQDGSELNALRERVKMLSSEKATLQEKLKKLSKAKKG